MTPIQRLLELSRPVKSFTVKISGEEVTYKTKKAGRDVSALVSAVWDKAYAETMAQYDDAKNADSTTVTMKLQSKESLARFVATLSRQEFITDYAKMLSKERDDEEVIALAATAVEERAKEILEARSHEDILTEALNNRRHFYGVSQANEAGQRTLLLNTIFVTDEAGALVPLFTEELIGEIPGNILDDIFKASQEALTDPDPLM